MAAANLQYLQPLKTIQRSDFAMSAAFPELPIQCNAVLSTSKHLQLTFFAAFQL